MRKVLVTTLLVAATVGSQAQVKKQSHGYPIDPVPFTSVKVTDSFWGQRLNASREVTIPLAFSKCEETGRYQNFVNAAHPSDTIKVGGLAFDDTDVYKTIEGASYLLQTYPDKKLAKYIDSVLVIVAAAQEPDGYLYTSRTMNPKHPHEWAGSKRWEKVEDLSHEFYNLGHMVEGAIAHYQAPERRTSSISPSDMPTAYAVKSVQAKDSKSVSPDIRLPKWHLPNFIWLPETRNTSTRPSSSSTSVDIPVVPMNTARHISRWFNRMKLWDTPFAPHICMQVWPT